MPEPSSRARSRVSANKALPLTKLERNRANSKKLKRYRLPFERSAELRLLAEKLSADVVRVIGAGEDTNMA